MNWTDDTRVIDLSDAPSFRDAAPARKLWMMVFLLALRDRADTIRFATGGSLARLSYVIDGKDYELAPPPPHVAGQLMDVVRRGFEADPPPARLGRLVGLFARSVLTSDLADFPWWSSFRLRLGDAVADVAATARAGGDARVLTITLLNVAIDPDAASGRLRGLMEEHFARNGGRRTGGTGTQG